MDLSSNRFVVGRGRGYSCEAGRPRLQQAAQNTRAGARAGGCHGSSACRETTAGSQLLPAGRRSGTDEGPVPAQMQ